MRRGGSDEDVTIDELARATGCTVRNIRALQSAGVLPGPQVRGRTGFYSAGHVRRLQAVLRLQADGFSLAAVRALLTAWEEGRTLDEVLGLPPGPKAARRSGPVPAPDPFEEFTGRPRQPRLLTVVPTSMFEAPGVEAAS